MAADFGETARLLGIVSAAIVAVLLLVYAVVLITGLRRTQSRDQPIAGRLFRTLEVLILAMAPALVALMAAVHAWAARGDKVLGLIALLFIGLVAAVTCIVHFSILTLSNREAFVKKSWAPIVFSFRWPSVAYALDILAWDVFFALAMFFAAPVFGGTGLANTVRVLMIVSGVLALAGVLGVITSDMRYRNIGIIGYVGVFWIVSVLLVIVFWRAEPLNGS